MHLYQVILTFFKLVYFPRTRNIEIKLKAS